jgi:N-acetylmuramidase
LVYLTEYKYISVAETGKQPEESNEIVRESYRELARKGLDSGPQEPEAEKKERTEAEIKHTTGVNKVKTESQKSQERVKISVEVEQDQGSKGKEKQQGAEQAASTSTTAEDSPSNSTSTPPPPSNSAGAGAATGALVGAKEASEPGVMDKVKIFFSQMFGNVKSFFSTIKDKLFGFLGKGPEAASSTTTELASTASSSTEASSETVSENWEDMVESEAKRVGIEPAALFAVIKTEIGPGNGPFSKTTNKPIIRFEPHYFNARHKGPEQAGWGETKLVGRHVDGVSCEPGQVNEQECFQRAIEINEKAAYASISMGLPQLMGAYAGAGGYKSGKEMYEAFSNKRTGAAAQVRAMAKLVGKNRALKNHQWGKFCTQYNTSKPGSATYKRYTSSLKRNYRNYSPPRGNNTRNA